MKIAESMWRVMEWLCDEKVNAVTVYLKKCVEEEYEMVAIPTYRNDGRGSRKSQKMEA